MGLRLFFNGILLGLTSVLLSCGPASSDLQPSTNPENGPEKKPDQLMILSTAKSEGLIVDRIHGSRNQLLQKRSLGFQHFTDQCLFINDQNNYAQVISQFVFLNLFPRKADFSGTGLSSIVDLPDSQSMSPTSFLSHPLCKVTKDSLRVTLGEGRVPDEVTIERINKFSQRVNEFRSQKDLSGVLKSYSRLFMCLAYVESLTTADTATSIAVAQSVAPAEYEKPPGVKFYLDAQQNPQSRLNIGMFQFTPNSKGNILPCLRHWNSAFPSCQVGLSSNQDEMIRTLGSSKQFFNAFCGVDKVFQTFSVQVNTQKETSTHPQNSDQGQLQPADNRCVSLHFRSGLAYNHFGPLQNTTGKNLAKLMECTLAD